MRDGRPLDSGVFLRATCAARRASPISNALAAPEAPAAGTRRTKPAGHGARLRCRRVKSLPASSAARSPRRRQTRFRRWQAPAAGTGRTETATADHGDFGRAGPRVIRFRRHAPAVIARLAPVVVRRCDAAVPKARLPPSAALAARYRAHPPTASGHRLPPSLLPSSGSRGAPRLHFPAAKSLLRDAAPWSARPSKRASILSTPRESHLVSLRPSFVSTAPVSAVLPFSKRTDDCSCPESATQPARPAMSGRESEPLSLFPHLQRLAEVACLSERMLLPIERVDRRRILILGWQLCQRHDFTRGHERGRFGEIGKSQYA